MHPKNGWDAVQHEILEEKAATIGRLGGDLRDALEALDAFKKQASSSNHRTAADRSDVQRQRLVDAAAYALWNFTVQRDCAGLGWMTRHVLEDYAVPPEVRANMGAVSRPVRDN
jgi:hypothetical protein